MNKAFVKKYEAALKKLGSQRAVARDWRIPRSSLQDALKRASQPSFSSTKPTQAKLVKTPRKGVRRFIFTSAQNETDVHEGFLTNLEAYAEFLGATLHVGCFTYNKSLFEEHDKSEKNQWYHPRIRKYLSNERLQIGDNVVWCGEMNTLPTAVSPLSGFETYTQERWGIFPHAKVQLVSVPTLKHAPAKQIMTTGAVTLPNYVQRRAGIKAEFHHIIGALLVEIDNDGDYFCRHLLAEEDGSFYDIMARVSNGVIIEGANVEAITWGDIHHEHLDPIVAKVCWGASHGRLSMLDHLQPGFQFFHDTIDFSARNYHNLEDPHFWIKKFVEKKDSVERDIARAAAFLERAQRDWCQTVVVESNHDLALQRWLKEADWRRDPTNARFWLRAQLQQVVAIENHVEGYSIFEWAMREAANIDDVVFLREDDTFTICHGQIECAVHGHLGANGAKGTPRQFTRMGPRVNTAHTHAPSIIEGVYTAGTSSKLDLGYNRGLSNWSHAHIVTFPNGKRTIVTLRNGKYCAA